MSKQVRTLIIVGAGILVLVALLLVLLLTPALGGGSTSSSASADNSSTVDTSVSLLDKSKDADGKNVENPVKKAVVKTGDEEYTVAPNKDGQLTVQAYQDLPVNTTAIDSLVQTLATITATRKITDDPDLLTGESAAAQQQASDSSSAAAVGGDAAFGLDKPLSTVTVTYHDDTIAVFELGNLEPMETGYYFRESGKRPVYLVDTTFAGTLQLKSTAYIGTTLYAGPTVKEGDSSGQVVVRDLDLTGSIRKDQPVSIVLTSQTADAEKYQYSSHLITKPYKRTVSASTDMTTLFSSFSSLTAGEALVPHPTKADLTKYGFGDPLSVAVFRLAVSTTKSSLAAANNSSSSAGTSSGTSEDDDKEVIYGTEEHTVTIGGKNDDGNYYVMVNGIDVIYLVSSAGLSWAEVRYNDLVNPGMFLESIDNIDSIAFTIDGKTTTFKLEHVEGYESGSDEELNITAGGKKYSTSEFRGLYQVLMGLQRYGDADAKPTGSPALIIDVVPIKGKADRVTASLYKTSASSYTCVHADGDSYKVRGSTIENVVRQFENYLAGKPVSTDY